MRRYPRLFAVIGFVGIALGGALSWDGVAQHSAWRHLAGSVVLVAGSLLLWKFFFDREAP